MATRKKFTGTKTEETKTALEILKKNSEGYQKQIEDAMQWYLQIFQEEPENRSHLEMFIVRLVETTTQNLIYRTYQTFNLITKTKNYHAKKIKKTKEVKLRQETEEV